MSYTYFNQSALEPFAAPPAASVRILAQVFGASCSLRFSPRSYSGLVLVARFAQSGAARSFASLASRLAGGVSCKVRGAAVSVPVSPASPLPPLVSPRQVVAQVAAMLRQPLPSPGGQCVAYTRAGAQCSRKASHGHYCRQHYRLVG